jgi:hypothetical protein
MRAKIVKDLGIVNQPLPLYMENRGTLVLSYQGLDFTALLKTNFLGLAIVKEAKVLGYDLRVGLRIDESFQRWILEPLVYVDKCFTAFQEYQVVQNEKGLANHREIAQTLQIPWPLDVSFSSEGVFGTLIAVSGPVNVSLPNETEKALAARFQESGLVSVPNYYDSVGQHVGSIQEAINLVSGAKTVISTDNFWLYLASAFVGKKVTGIFGPTLPDFITKQSSAKLIQLTDEGPAGRGVVKSCPCQNPKFCHHSLKIPPYCLGISTQKLIDRLDANL